jgi:hypothetical protein
MAHEAEVIKLEASGYHFNATLTVERDFRTKRAHTYGVRVGTSLDGTACVSISVTAPHEDVRFQAALPADIASLNSVQYSPCCAEGAQPLRRGGGTAVMVRAACRLVLQKYPWVRAFKLTDSSEVQCGSSTISLPALSLCYSGFTWYERVFSAELADTDMHTAYRLLVKEQLQAPEAKPSSFGAFCEEANVPVSSRELLRPIYEAQPTLMSFFAAARKQLLNDHQHQFCTVVGPWVGAFIDARLRRLHCGQWIIHAAVLTSDNSDVEVNQWGGEESQLSWCCRSHVHWGALRQRATMSIPVEDL